MFSHALRCCAVIALAVLSATNAKAERYGLGETASAELIAEWDIAIGPKGGELPAGGGDAKQGKAIYAAKCAMCHGLTGREGPDPILIGGTGSLTSDKPLLTVGSFWPYATTLYDYIYRAMPFLTPGSLTPDEVYAVSAYILAENGVIAHDLELNRKSLPQVAMPNRDGFIPDPRPDMP